MSHSSIPVIGITMYGRNAIGCFSLQTSYVDAVRAAGGIPILLAPGESQTNSILVMIDGLILAGGGDIAPTVYNGDSHPAIYSVDPERDRFELELAELAMNQNLPILGICRGIQVLNVVSGGDLIPHLPDLYDEIAHRIEGAEQTKMNSTCHQVEIMQNTRLAAAMGTDTSNVTSWHHQAVQNVPVGWKIVALAPDGVIEAIEHESHPWAVAVQWHPEMSANERSHQGLFSALVQAASQVRNKK